MQTFRAGGKGGQNQNKVNSGVRLIHKPSGARGEARDSRDQHQNRKAALQRLAASKEFKLWHRAETAKRLGLLDGLDEAIDAAMNPANIRVEVLTKEGWSLAPETG